MKRIRPGAAVALTALVCAVLAACGTTSDGDNAAQDSANDDGGGKLKAMLLYVGPAQDGGYNSSFEATRTRLQDKYGDQLEFTFKENVPETAQARQVIDAAVQDGYKLIIGNGYGYGPHTIASAKKHPDVYFLQSQWAPPKNLANFSGFDLGVEDGFYLAGMAAAGAAKTGRLGMVNAFPIPFEMRVMNAMVLGARRVNADATTRVVMTNSWFDPPKDVQAVNSLISSGAEVVVNPLNDPAIPQTSEEKDTYSIGSGIEHGDLAPTKQVADVVYDWAPLLEPAIEAARDGTWKPVFTYLGAKDGVIKLEPGPAFDGLNADVKAEIEDAQAALSSGELNVFTGPIVDNRGKTVVADGEQLELKDLIGMTFVLDGLEGVKASK
jgi:basic membrane protein A and related proteins